ncbi:uncharacterized protein PG998_013015 [Apiospora kogelbergensis]|uniref:uncharacterized protein n=1 Tax=Apiospora kogelbergensis TaxID=1337665 RepID=UPI0031311A32
MDDDVEEVGAPLALLEGLLTSHNLFGSPGKIRSLWHGGDVDLDEQRITSWASSARGGHGR